MRIFKKAMTLAVTATVLCGLASCSAKPAAETSAASSAAVSESTEMTTEAAETTETSATEKVSKYGKAVVVYFACTGTTKGVATKIASSLGCATYEIVPSKPYSEEDLNYSNKKSRAAKEQNDKAARPEISKQISGWNTYDTVFIGYPIWFGKAPRILCTFVESQEFEGKTVIPFCTSGSSGIGSSAMELENLAKNKGTWLSGTRFAATVKSTDIAEWLDTVESGLK